MTQDALGRTREECEEDARIARDVADDLLGELDGIPIGVAFNLIGNLAVAIFRAVPFTNPLDALGEFDEWASYTRSIIETEIKGRVQ